MVFRKFEKIRNAVFVGMASGSIGDRPDGVQKLLWPRGVIRKDIIVEI